MFLETFPQLLDASIFSPARVPSILDHTKILELLEERYRIDLLADSPEIIDFELEYIYIRAIYKDLYYTIYDAYKGTFDLIFYLFLRRSV